MARLYISNSGLENVAQCATKYVLNKHRWQSPDDSAALVCGNATHAALEHWRKGGSIEEAIGVFAGLYSVFSAEHVPVDDPRDCTNVSKILKHYMEVRGPGNVPYERILYIEQAFAMPLWTNTDGDEYWYYTRPDMVVERGGEVHTFDTKTTGRLDKNWSKQWDVSPQITGQMVTVSKVLGRPVTGALIDGIEFSRLNAAPRKCAKHGVPYYECALQHLNFAYVLADRTENLRRMWEIQTLGLMQHANAVSMATAKYGLDSTSHEGIYTGTCAKYGSHCTFWQFCSAGMQSDQLSVMFKQGDFNVMDAGTILGPGMEPVVFDGGL